MKLWLRERLWYRLRHHITRGSRALRNLQRSSRISLADADRLFPPQNKCVHCGAWHEHSCPRIKTIEFKGEGTPARVDFWAWGEWPADQVVFPWQKAAMIDPDLLEGEVVGARQ